MPKHIMPLIPSGLLVQQVLPAPDRIPIVTVPRQDAAACPGCAVCSSRVHSPYNRLLSDLPWQGRPVTLQVQTRRFRCLNPLCTRQTFAECLPGVAAAAARRTERLCGLQGCLGVALGGEAGARLAARLAMATSPDTLLRMVRASSRVGDTPPTPRVLGVDDWSWRRGHRYGTVLVELERNKVVDLVATHARDMIQVVLSIQAGRVMPSMLLRKLGTYNRRSLLYRAFRELGRVERTLFLLRLFPA